MDDNLDKIGIFDVTGQYTNPLNNRAYSEDYKNLAKIWSNYPSYQKNNIKN